MKAYPQGQVWVRFPFVCFICLLSTNVSFSCRVDLSPFSAPISTKSTTPLSNSPKPSPIPRQRSFLPTTLSLALSVKIPYASFFPLRKSHTDVITPSSLHIAPTSVPPPLTLTRITQFVIARFAVFLFGSVGSASIRSLRCLV